MLIGWLFRFSVLQECRHVYRPEYCWFDVPQCHWANAEHANMAANQQKPKVKHNTYTTSENSIYNDLTGDGVIQQSDITHTHIQSPSLYFQPMIDHGRDSTSDFMQQHASALIWQTLTTAERKHWKKRDVWRCSHTASVKFRDLRSSQRACRSCATWSIPVT